MNKVVIGAALLALSVAGITHANPVVIQPNEALSSDVFVYQGSTGPPNGPGGTNFEMPGYNVVLSSGMTGTGHDTNALIKFDLTGVTLNPGEHAYLRLYVADGSAPPLSGLFGVNPSAGAPVTAEVYTIGGAWNEASVTWNTKPSIVGSVVDSQSINGINQWISFDVTTAVSNWLDSSLANNGFLISQPAVVLNGGKVVALYDAASGTNRPMLEVVPEPASIGFLAIGAMALLARRRR